MKYFTLTLWVIVAVFIKENIPSDWYYVWEYAAGVIGCIIINTYSRK